MLRPSGLAQSQSPAGDCLGPWELFRVLPRAGAKSNLAHMVVDRRSPKVTLAAASPGWVWVQNPDWSAGPQASSLSLRPAEDHQPEGELDTAAHAGRQPAGPPTGDPREVLLCPLRAGRAWQLLLLRTRLPVRTRPRCTGPRGGHGERGFGWLAQGRGQGQGQVRMDSADHVLPARLGPRGLRVQAQHSRPQL